MWQLQQADRSRNVVHVELVTNLAGFNVGAPSLSLAGVILRSTSAASIHAVFGSISAQTILPPRFSIGVLVATQVIGVVMTSAPGPTPESLSASVSELVQEFVSTSGSTPRHAATALRKAVTCTPSLTSPTRTRSPVHQAPPQCGGGP